MLYLSSFQIVPHLYFIYYPFNLSSLFPSSSSSSSRFPSHFLYIHDFYFLSSTFIVLFFYLSYALLRVFFLPLFLPFRFDSLTFTSYSFYILYITPFAPSCSPIPNSIFPLSQFIHFTSSHLLSLSSLQSHLHPPPHLPSYVFSLPIHPFTYLPISYIPFLTTLYSLFSYSHLIPPLFLFLTSTAPHPFFLLLFNLTCIFPDVFTSFPPLYFITLPFSFYAFSSPDLIYFPSIKSSSPPFLHL